MDMCKEDLYQLVHVSGKQQHKVTRRKTYSQLISLLISVLPLETLW